MTKCYLVQTKTEDLKAGDMFVTWAAQLEDFPDRYPTARRVMDCHKGPGGTIEFSLDDGCKIKTQPEMLMIVEVLA